METSAETLNRLTNNIPVPCDVFASEGETHHLHKLTWIEQMLLDATVHDFIDMAKQRGLGEVATRIMLTKVSSIGVIQASLRKGPEPTAPLVFPSLPEAVAALNSRPEDVLRADAIYAKAFDITDEEKKS